jgi:hypothetical protein
MLGKRTVSRRQRCARLGSQRLAWWKPIYGAGYAELLLLEMRPTAQERGISEMLLDRFKDELARPRGRRGEFWILLQR